MHPLTTSLVGRTAHLLLFPFQLAPPVGFLVGLLESAKHLRVQTTLLNFALRRNQILHRPLPSTHRRMPKIFACRQRLQSLHLKHLPLKCSDTAPCVYHLCISSIAIWLSMVKRVPMSGTLTATMEKLSTASRLPLDILRCALVLAESISRRFIALMYMHPRQHFRNTCKETRFQRDEFERD